MPQITLLSQETIDKIAAGEVIERPASVVKELVENAIDAKATAITIEVKEGGISFIRITDNGCGILKNQISTAFLRHSTSKIKSIEDLLTVSSLGFRGEALSSIAAISQVEVITKTPESLLGVRYIIEGSREKELEEIGAPDGTTFLVRNIFFNTPARKKFLKTAQTETSYISDLMERIALSHPEISFKFISNNQLKLQTSGNGNVKDIIYHIYGRDITSALLEIEGKTEFLSFKGFIGKPLISRGNRNYETFFMNGRYIKSKLLSKGVEDSYKSFLMQHQYPFVVLYFEIDGHLLDVNVHPTKMELRFFDNEHIYQTVLKVLRDKLLHKDLIPSVGLNEEKKELKPKAIKEERKPEPFEKQRMEKIVQSIQKDSPYERQYSKASDSSKSFLSSTNSFPQKSEAKNLVQEETIYERNASERKYTDSPTSDLNVRNSDLPESHEKPGINRLNENESLENEALKQVTLADELGSDFLKKDTKARYHMIGQLFSTYWLFEFEDKLFIVDQHAAHEKVLYEKTMHSLQNKTHTSQTVSPPIILSLSMKEEETLKKYQLEFEKLGYNIEYFGGKEYAVCAVPADMYGINEKQLFIEMLDDIEITGQKIEPELVLSKVATMSCKAAVKGNQKISMAEMEQLFDDLIQLDNPYLCPHGRPTIISMTKYELEKKFKRII